LSRPNENCTNRNGNNAAEECVAADKVENGSIHKASPGRRIPHKMP
jgi:hypothetical protein